MAKKGMNRLSRRQRIIALSLAAFLILAGAYYYIFIHDDLSGGGVPVDIETPGAQAVAGSSYYARSKVEIHERADPGAAVIRTLPRGEMITGVAVVGEDGAPGWIALDNGRGFARAGLLGPEMPVDLLQYFGGKNWKLPDAADILARPADDAPLLVRLPGQSRVEVNGVADNDYLEVRTGDAQIGYLPDAKSILRRMNAQPVAIRFDPDNCRYGRDIDALFDRMGNNIRADYEALERKEFADDAAREAAFAAIEGKSHFMRLERSFEGLLLTGIAQHYESQSLYFADPPEKVIATFRRLGLKIDGQGQVASTDLYASIGRTQSGITRYGASDLICGV